MFLRIVFRISQTISLLRSQVDKIVLLRPKNPVLGSSLNDGDKLGTRETRDSDNLSPPAPGANKRSNTGGVVSFGLSGRKIQHSAVYQKNT